MAKISKHKVVDGRLLFVNGKICVQDLVKRDDDCGYSPIMVDVTKEVAVAIKEYLND